jgi:hypothetical protein
MVQEVIQNEDPVATVDLGIGDPVAGGRDFVCAKSGESGAGSVSV